MGSTLAPLLANVYMSELENRIIPELANYMNPWYRYVDDTFAFIDPTKIYTIVEELNSFHHNIQFTFEKESENKLSFLDVLVNRLPDGNLSTIYRKPINKFCILLGISNISDNNFLFLGWTGQMTLKSNSDI